MPSQSVESVACALGLVPARPATVTRPHVLSLSCGPRTVDARRCFSFKRRIRASNLEVTGYGCSEVSGPSKFPMAPHMGTSNWIRTMNLSGTRMSRYRHAMGVEIADEEEGDDGYWGPGGWGTTGDRRRADERKDGLGKLGLAAVEGTD
ncbi:hypothetical protein CCHR01_04630 [Colletotrichum chrysophilum]|uniref:Uncharacterized protein n=1 Tax=Colletotrichum chrysophilum TaxID=1836956 RepID=A0AAD9EIF0_9PEZI|nr:hypothetical protein CCHR01_04630 [Colletotrichum chrysophilum]